MQVVSWEILETKILTFELSGRLKGGPVEPACWRNELKRFVMRIEFNRLNALEWLGEEVVKLSVQPDRFPLVASKMMSSLQLK